MIHPFVQLALPSASILLMLATLLAAVFLGSTSAANIEEFMKNKRWGCPANGACCFNLDPQRSGDCDYEMQGYICRPGYYEALDGTCRPLSLECLEAAGKNGSDLSQCPGCTHQDKPEGQTVLGCLEEESTCLANSNANAKCEEHKKRQICPVGYYRAMPENKCYRNEDIKRDRLFPKPGCDQLLQNSCGPNSHYVCVGDFYAPALCALTGEFHEGRVKENNVMLRSGLPSEEKDCGYRCVCNDGFVRESEKPMARCISKEQCRQKNKKECSSPYEDYHECPQVLDDDCLKMKIIQPGCNASKIIVKDFSDDEKCGGSGAKPVVGGGGGGGAVDGNSKIPAVCRGPPQCLCKEGLVRLGEHCVTMEQCKDYRLKYMERTAGIEQAIRMAAGGK